MQAEKAAQRRLVGEAGAPRHGLYVEPRVPEQGLDLDNDIVGNHLMGGLAVYLQNDFGQVYGRYAQLIGIKSDLPARFVDVRRPAWRTAWRYFPCWYSRKGASWRSSSAGKGHRNPSNKSAQVQNGLPQENGIVVAAPEIDRPAKPQKPVSVHVVDAVQEILPHIEEKIRGYFSQPAHDVKEHLLVYFEKGHREIVADLADRHQLQRQNRNDIVFGNRTAHRKNLYHSGTSRANTAETLLLIGLVFAYRQRRNIGIYLEFRMHADFIALNIRHSPSPHLFNAKIELEWQT